MGSPLALAAAAAQTCSPVVKVERRDPLDPGNGYAWPDMYAGTWLQPTKRFVRFEPRKIGNIEGAVHAHVYGGVNGLQPTPALTRDFFDFSVWSTFQLFNKNGARETGPGHVPREHHGTAGGYTANMPSLISISRNRSASSPSAACPPQNIGKRCHLPCWPVVLSMTDALQRVVVATCDEAHAMRAREALQGVDRVIVHNLNLEKCQLPYLPRATQAT